MTVSEFSQSKGVARAENKPQRRMRVKAKVDESHWNAKPGEMFSFKSILEFFIGGSIFFQKLSPSRGFCWGSEIDSWVFHSDVSHEFQQRWQLPNFLLLQPKLASIYLKHFRTQTFIHGVQFKAQQPFTDRSPSANTFVERIGLGGFDHWFRQIRIDGHPFTHVMDVLNFIPA
jgi:hypothetical protein